MKARRGLPILIVCLLFFGIIPFTPAHADTLTWEASLTTYDSHEFGSPYDLTYYGGIVYVADGEHNQIVSLNASTLTVINFTSFAFGNGTNQMMYSAEIKNDGTYLYILDLWNDTFDQDNRIIQLNITDMSWVNSTYMHTSVFGFTTGLVYGDSKLYVFNETSGVHNFVVYNATSLTILENKTDAAFDGEYGSKSCYDSGFIYLPRRYNPYPSILKINVTDWSYSLLLNISYPIACAIDNGIMYVTQNDWIMGPKLEQITALNLSTLATIFSYGSYGNGTDEFERIDGIAAFNDDIWTVDDYWNWSAVNREGGRIVKLSYYSTPVSGGVGGSPGEDTSRGGGVPGCNCEEIEGPYVTVYTKNGFITGKGIILNSDGTINITSCGLESQGTNIPYPIPSDYILGRGGSGIIGIIQEAAANIMANYRVLPPLAKLAFDLLLLLFILLMLYAAYRKIDKPKRKSSTLFRGPGMYLRGAGTAFKVAQTMLFTLFLSFFLLYVAPQIANNDFVIYWGYIVLFTVMSYVGAFILLRWGMPRK